MAAAEMCVTISVIAPIGQSITVFWTGLLEVRHER
jgi:hypothetical protein